MASGDGGGSLEGARISVALRFGFRLWIPLCAKAAAGVYPVLLNEVLSSTERYVVLRPVCSSLGGTEVPGAFVAVLRAGGVVPCIQVGIGNTLFEFMRHDRRHAVGAEVTVGRWTAADSATGVRTAGWIADKRILDVHGADGSVGVPTAVLSAKARGFVDIRGRKHEI